MRSPPAMPSALSVLALATPCGAPLSAAATPVTSGAIGRVAHDGRVAGQRLVPTGFIDSPDGPYHLRFQNNGRGVLHAAGMRPWTSEGTSTSPMAAVMQANRSLLARDTSPAAAGMSGKADPPGAFLAVRDDGNVAIHADDMRMPWSRVGVPAARGEPRKQAGSLPCASGC